MRQPTVLIFAKPPRIGMSKTRLAKSLGSAVEARRIATMTQARTLRAALNGNWETILYTAPDAELTNSLGGIWPAHLERRGQGPGDLGDRLSKGLSEAPAGPVIFVGADAPGISSALIRKAVRELQRNDAVFGPARDGGFWLFGINKTTRTKSPFYGVRWSSPDTLADVKNNLGPAAKIGILPELIDIDSAEDLKAWNGAPQPVVETASDSGAAAQPEPAPAALTEIKIEDETEPTAPIELAAAEAAKPKKKGFFARLFGKG